MLSKDEVLNAIKEYPLAQKILAKYGRSRLKQDSNRNDGPRADTTSSDSENERTNSFVIANGGQAINTKEHVTSPHLRRNSYVTSFVKMKKPTEAEFRQSQALNNSEQPSHGTVMSMMNPVVIPSSSAVGIKSQNLSEVNSTRHSILINANAVRNESEDAKKMNKKDPRRVLSIEEERFLQFIKASQVELLGKMKQLFKKKMVNIKSFCICIRYRIDTSLYFTSKVLLFPTPFDYYQYINKIFELLMSMFQFTMQIESLY